MNQPARFKAVNSDVYTVMYSKDGKVYMNVYDEEGNLLDVMEEVDDEATEKKNA